MKKSTTNSQGVCGRDKNANTLCLRIPWVMCWSASPAPALPTVICPDSAGSRAPRANTGANDRNKMFLHMMLDNIVLNMVRMCVHRLRVPVGKECDRNKLQ